MFVRIFWLMTKWFPNASQIFIHKIFLNQHWNLFERYYLLIQCTVMFHIPLSYSPHSIHLKHSGQKSLWFQFARRCNLLYHSNTTHLPAVMMASANHAVWKIVVSTYAHTPPRNIKNTSRFERFGRRIKNSWMQRKKGPFRWSRLRRLSDFGEIASVTTAVCGLCGSLALWFVWANKFQWAAGWRPAGGLKHAVRCAPCFPMLDGSMFTCGSHTPGRATLAPAHHISTHPYPHASAILVTAGGGSFSIFYFCDTRPLA